MQTASKSFQLAVTHRSWSETEPASVASLRCWWKPDAGCFAFSDGDQEQCVPASDLTEANIWRIVELIGAWDWPRLGQDHHGVHPDSGRHGDVEFCQLSLSDGTRQCVVDYYEYLPPGIGYLFRAVACLTQREWKGQPQWNVGDFDRVLSGAAQWHEILMRGTLGQINAFVRQGDLADAGIVESICKRLEKHGIRALPAVLMLMARNRSQIHCNDSPAEVPWDDLIRPRPGAFTRLRHAISCTIDDTRTFSDAFQNAFDSNWELVENILTHRSDPTRDFFEGRLEADDRHCLVEWLTRVALDRTRALRVWLAAMSDFEEANGRRLLAKVRASALWPEVIVRLIESCFSQAPPPVELLPDLGALTAACEPVELRIQAEKLLSRLESSH